MLLSFFLKIQVLKINSFWCLGHCYWVWCLWSLLFDTFMPRLLDLRRLFDYSPTYRISHMDY